jgi:hypothetical protein
MKKNASGMAVGLLLLIFFVSFSWAQGPGLSIADMKAVPAGASPRNKVLISCRVTHPGGAGAIERVAATLFGADRATSYTMLYDDGTHGDQGAGDGVYSLLIRGPKVPGEFKIVFHAVTKDRHEVESQPIVLRVK